MGAKTVVKRQNHALLDRSEDILARHKSPEKIQVGVRTMGTRWYQAQEKFK